MRGPPPAAAPRDADGAGRPAARGRQGDRAAQPARLVELPLLPRLRARVEVPGLRRRAGAAPRAGAYLACHHCGHRERGSRAAARRAPRSRSPATAPAPSGSSTSSREALGGDGFPSSGSTRTRSRPRRSARGSSQRFEAGRAGRAGRHPDGRQGPRLPRRLARRRARCRRDAALPRLPRRGAHVRARHPARRAHRPRRARRPRARADARSRRARRSATPPAHDADGFLADELERRRALQLPAVRAPDPGRLLRARCRRCRRRPRGDRRRARADRRSRARARRRCSACGAAPVASWSSRRPTATPAIAAVGRCRRPDRAAGGRAAGASVSVDVDPQ